LKPETEALFVHMRDLALEQKAAIVEGNFDEAESLGEKRQRMLVDIQQSEASSDAEKSEELKALIREIIDIDEEAVKVLKAGMQEVSQELENINTFKVLFRGAIDSAQFGGNDTAL
jgi:hypothetical protein